MRLDLFQLFIIWLELMFFKIIQVCPNSSRLYNCYIIMNAPIATTTATATTTTTATTTATAAAAAK